MACQVFFVNHRALTVEESPADIADEMATAPDAPMALTAVSSRGESVVFWVNPRQIVWVR